jgi:Methyltransferase domain
MASIGWFIVLLIVLGIIIWQLSVWIDETRFKNKQYQTALAYARSKNKPLLIAGGPYGNRRIRHLLKIPAHGSGDFCLDINREAVDGHPNAVIASVTHIPFSDKTFGAVFASHLLEHLPTTTEGRQALAELNRTAEAVFIVSPSRQSISGWLHPDHHLWVWQKGETTHLKQRGKPSIKQKEEYTNDNG